MNGSNRYAWTDVGFVKIVNGRQYTTLQVRKWLVKTFNWSTDSFARNWASGLGWCEVEVEMPHRNS